MPIQRPHYASNFSEADADKNEFSARVYAADLYAERTAQAHKDAHADRLAETRLKAIDQAIAILSHSAAFFSEDEMFALADRIVSFARKGGN